mmetsp:Transcript_25796/g.72493  ORF Transcript_25796/g.72493 Transcript_25796/m.72493 type:complete len:257 (+) Transcript_25796:47-817(+)
MTERTLPGNSIKQGTDGHDPRSFPLLEVHAGDDIAPLRVRIEEVALVEDLAALGLDLVFDLGVRCINDFIALDVPQNVEVVATEKQLFGDLHGVPRDQSQNLAPLLVDLLLVAAILLGSGGEELGVLVVQGSVAGPNYGLRSRGLVPSKHGVNHLPTLAMQPLELLLGHGVLLRWLLLHSRLRLGAETVGPELQRRRAGRRRGVLAGAHEEQPGRRQAHDRRDDQGHGRGPAALAHRSCGRSHRAWHDGRNRGEAP